MRALALTCLAVLMLSSAALLADDHSVLFDDDVDFSAFKTFMLREATLKAKAPSVSSPVLVKALAESMRAALTARGLKESATGADLVVECSVTGVNFDMNKWGALREMRDDTSGRGRRGSGPQSNHPDFIEATLVIDMKRGDAGPLLWRGVYHDTEPDASRLVDTLPKDVAVLLGKYPVRIK